MLKKLSSWIKQETFIFMSHHFYPGNDGSFVRKDPTRGKIDRDIQWSVDSIFNPKSASARVVLENHIQEKRNTRRWINE